MDEKPHLAAVLSAAFALAPTQAVAAPTASASTTSTSGSGPVVHVEVVRRLARGPVRLHARYVDLERTRWIERANVTMTQVCEAPCDRKVPEASEASFIVSGPRVARSNVFTIPDRDRVEVIVEPRPRGVRPLGLVLAPLGAAGMVAGAVTMIVANDDTRLLAAGGITLGVSVPLVIAGAILARWGRSRARVAPR